MYESLYEAPGPHPELEELAAFVDGRLSPTDRTRVAEHLADCGECYELVSETARFQRETQEAPEEGADPLPFKARPKFKKFQYWIASAAAAALVAVAGWGVYQASRPPTAVSVAELVEPVQKTPGVVKQIRPEPVYRGPGQETPQFRDDSFRFGVLVIDLHLSLPANSPISKNLLWAIVGVIHRLDFPEQTSKAFYEKAYSDLDKKRKAPRDLAAEAVQYESSQNDSLSQLFLPFGKWTEAARLAAATGTSEFFESRSNQRLMDWLVQQLQQEMHEQEPGDEKERLAGTLSTLQEIQKIWDAGRFGHPELQKLQTDLEQIIDTYDPKSPEING